MDTNKLHIYMRNILFGLILLYFSQGSLYPQGGIVSQISLFSIFVISGSYFIITLGFVNKDKFYNVWSMFMLLNILGFFLTTSISVGIHFSMLKAILLTFLLFYPFYFFTRKGLLKHKHLLVFFIVMLPITILSFYFNQSSILADRLLGSDDVVNNVTFTFARLIPFVFLFSKKRILSSASLLVLVYFIILGSKRGTLIAAIAGALIFAYYQLSITDKKNRMRDTILGVVFILVISFFIIDFYINNEYLLDRMTDMVGGNSSGRDIIFANLFNSWYESDSYLRLLLGFGYGSSIYLSGTGNIAHNDFLEILSNFGLVGLILYLLLLFYAIRFMFDKTNSKQNIMLMLSCISIWIIIGLTARSYYAIDSYLHSIVFAYLFGLKFADIEVEDCKKD